MAPSSAANEVTGTEIAKAIDKLILKGDFIHPFSGKIYINNIEIEIKSNHTESEWIVDVWSNILNNRVTVKSTALCTEIVNLKGLSEIGDYNLFLRLCGFSPYIIHKK